MGEMSSSSETSSRTRSQMFSGGVSTSGGSTANPQISFANGIFTSNGFTASCKGETS